MRVCSYATIIAVIAAVSSTAAIDKNLQDGSTSNFFSLVEEKLEHATAMLDNILRNNLGVLTMEKPREQSDQVMVPDLKKKESSLSEENRQVACNVALTQLAYKRALTKEAKSMHSHLHSHLRPMFHIHTGASVHYERCNDLEQDVMRYECNRILAKEKEITLWLKQLKTNEEICALTRPLESVEFNPLSCKLCKRLVEMVDKAIEQDMTEVEQVREIIGDLCDSMSPDSMCHTFIKRYDDIVAWLKSGTDPVAVCFKIQMCPPANTAKLLIFPHKEEIEEEPHTCFYCVNINAIISYVLNKAPTQEKALHEILKYGCTLVPQNCKCSVLDENFDKIVDWIKQGKHPHEICENLNLCSKLSPIANDHDELAPTNEIVTSSYIFPSIQNGVDNCLFCDYLSTILEIFIHEDTGEMELVDQYAKMICDMLDDDNVCQQYLTEKNLVVSMLKKNKKPREICAELKYCRANNMGQPTNSLAATPDMTVAVVDNTHECFYCIHIVKVIRFVVQNTPAELPKVRDLIKYGCNLVPKECKCAILDQNFDKIVQLIQQGKHPFEVCENIGSCKKDQQGLILIPSEEESKISDMLDDADAEGKDDKTCLYCEVFTTLIEVAIQQDKEQVDEIRQYADMICGMLGDQNLCHQYVNKLDLVVDHLKRGDSTRKICGDLNFCANELRNSVVIGRVRTSVNAFLVKNNEPIPDGGNIVELQ